MPTPRHFARSLLVDCDIPASGSARFERTAPTRVAPHRMTLINPLRPQFRHRRRAGTMRIGGARNAADGARPQPPLIASPALQANMGGDRAAALPPSLLGPSAMRRQLPAPTVLVFDSGLGGLTVFREVARARPDARVIYAADDALFPYGQIE